MKARRRDEAISLEIYVQKARALVMAHADPERQAQEKCDVADLEVSHIHQDQGEPNEVDLEGNRVRQAQGQDDELSQRNQIWETKKGSELEARKLFVDLASSRPDRLTVLKSFLVSGDDKKDDKKPHPLLQKGLFDSFDRIYTKYKFALMLGEEDLQITQLRPNDIVSLCVRGATMCLPVVAIGLFHKSHREAYNVHDVKVTYALLCCTAALESYSVLGTRAMFPPTVSGMVAQYSLIGYFASNKKHTKKMCSSSFRITMLVLRHVKGWWMEHITDVASYWRFNDHRGQWTIQHNGCDQEHEWALSRPFDESVLLWHIATDLCFYQKGGTSVSHAKATGCREISNYMIYLLFVNPERLLSGTRQDLFMEANSELEEILMDDKPLLKKILKGEKPSLVEVLKFNKTFLEFLMGKGPSSEEIERGFVQIIIAKLQATECREEDPGCTQPRMEAEQRPSAEKGFIHDAWKISKVLLALGDEKMWEVIEGVWVEMLCFSASRCRGYLHVKSMGSGIELLTYVWFLLSRMGMETLPERLQRTEH
jgi:hypothetical protein